MKFKQFFAFAGFLMMTSIALQAQVPVEISPPELELKDNRIVISYRILRSSADDLFRIWIEVTDDNGKNLNATTLSGDAGIEVPGGGLKQIIWDYENDVVSIDNGIYVQVFGELYAPDEVDSGQLKGSGKGISKSGAILRSVGFPGLGLTAMTGKPHWLKGIAGYGAVASAVIFNKMAVASYNKYLDSSDLSEISDYFDTAVSQGNISNISAYAAIGIWITDIVWTLISNPGENSIGSAVGRNGINFGTVVEPHHKVPMLALRYNF